MEKGEEIAPRRCGKKVVRAIAHFTLTDAPARTYQHKPQKKFIRLTKMAQQAQDLSKLSPEDKEKMYGAATTVSLARSPNAHFSRCFCAFLLVAHNRKHSPPHFPHLFLPSCHRRRWSTASSSSTSTRRLMHRHHPKRILHLILPNTFRTSLPCSSRGAPARKKPKT